MCKNAGKYSKSSLLPWCQRSRGVQRWCANGREENFQSINHTAKKCKGKNRASLPTTTGVSPEINTLESQSG